MKGEVSEEFLRNEWFDEECNVDIEMKGYDYICKNARFLAPNETTHKRGIVSSQRIEMFNSFFKKKGNTALDMLHQFFHVATKCFEKSASILYPTNKILTNFAEDLLEKIIKCEFLSPNFAEMLHFQKNECECRMPFV